MMLRWWSQNVSIETRLKNAFQLQNKEMKWWKSFDSMLLKLQLRSNVIQIVVADESERCDVFSIETEHFCVYIDSEIAIYDEKKS